ncbi:MAG: hypothetical protein C3F12_04160 [Candidatus Methylomirabilota bacterium]|nr:DUF2141 domain-containing protein [Candidatus Methylomirabilis sp.]NJD69625.1 DUF2141 domain-containing protein [candidate division NC10 bacterium]PWB47182.1 MAG: hypothetical protein C3F12_04160 [candidate division NC10 bacterium]
MVRDGANSWQALPARGVSVAARQQRDDVKSFFVGFWFVCLLVLSWSGGAQAQIQATEGPCDRGASTAIDVRVHGVRSDRGNIMFVLYGDNPDDFLVKGKRIFKQHFAAKRGTVAFCIAVSAGTYAASVYHDENGNKKLDRNWIGIPAEGAGFSNNPTLLVGPPSHAQAAFQVSHGPTRIDIQLNYSIVSGQQGSNRP